MLTLRKVGIPSFEFEGSGMGSAYTDTKIQKNRFRIFWIKLS